MLKRATGVDWPYITHDLFTTMKDCHECTRQPSNQNTNTKLEPVFSLLTSRFHRHGHIWAIAKSRLGDPVRIGDEKLLLKATHKQCLLQRKGRACFIHLLPPLNHPIRTNCLHMNRKWPTIGACILRNPLLLPCTEAHHKISISPPD